MPNFKPDLTGTQCPPTHLQPIIITRKFTITITRKFTITIFTNNIFVLVNIEHTFHASSLFHNNKLFANRKKVQSVDIQTAYTNSPILDTRIFNTEKKTHKSKNQIRDTKVYADAETNRRHK